MLLHCVHSVGGNGHEHGIHLGEMRVVWRCKLFLFLVFFPPSFSRISLNPSFLSLVTGAAQLQFLESPGKTCFLGVSCSFVCLLSLGFPELVGLIIFHGLPSQTQRQGGVREEIQGPSRQGLHELREAEDGGSRHPRFILIFLFLHFFFFLPFFSAAFLVCLFVCGPITFLSFCDLFPFSPPSFPFLTARQKKKNMLPKKPFPSN